MVTINVFIFNKNIKRRLWKWIDPVEIEYFGVLDVFVENKNIYCYHFVLSKRNLTKLTISYRIRQRCALCCSWKWFLVNWSCFRVLGCHWGGYFIKNITLRIPQVPSETENTCFFKQLNGCDSCLKICHRR